MTDIFEPKITLGNVLSLIIGIATLIFAVIAVKDKVEQTDASMARIEATQQVILGKMDNWYERLVRLEERDREREREKGKNAR